MRAGCAIHAHARMALVLLLAAGCNGAPVDSSWGRRVARADPKRPEARGRADRLAGRTRYTEPGAAAASAGQTSRRGQSLRDRAARPAGPAPADHRGVRRQRAGRLRPGGGRVVRAAVPARSGLGRRIHQQRPATHRGRRVRAPAERGGQGGGRVGHQRGESAAPAPLRGAGRGGLRRHVPRRCRRSALPSPPHRPGADALPRASYQDPPERRLQDLGLLGHGRRW